MIPGPTIIISCPSCGQYAKRETIISGNTFGSKLWSDGKRISPMMPDFPELVVCNKCNVPYWVKDAKEIETVSNPGDLKDKWSNISKIQLPTFNQYLIALETISDEKYVRIRIWWGYNDYIRNNKEDLITPEIAEMNTENLTALSKILDEPEIHELLMKAEVYRNLGKFEESKELLAKMTDPELTFVKEKFLQEINNQNKKVVRLY